MNPPETLKQLLSADTLQCADQLSDKEKYGIMKHLDDEGHNLREFAIMDPPEALASEYDLSADTSQWLDKASDEEKRGLMTYLYDEGHPLIPAANFFEVLEQRLTPAEKDDTVRYLSSAELNRIVYAFFYPQVTLEWLWYQLKSPSADSSPAHLAWLHDSIEEHPSNVHEMDSFVTKALFQAAKASLMPRPKQDFKLLSGRVVAGNNNFVVSAASSFIQVLHHSLQKTRDGDMLLEMFMFTSDEVDDDDDLGGRKIKMIKIQPVVLPIPE